MDASKIRIGLRLDDDYSCNAGDCTGLVDLEAREILGKPTRSPADYLVALEGARCRADGTELERRLDAYEHDGGWIVAGYPHKLWLSLHCPKCGYDWSINKLGVNR